jgi:hypothetical protein
VDLVILLLQHQVRDIVVVVQFILLRTMDAVVEGGLVVQDLLASALLIMPVGDPVAHLQ